MNTPEYILILTYQSGWKETIPGYTSRQQAEMHGQRLVSLGEVVRYEVRQDSRVLTHDAK